MYTQPSMELPKIVLVSASPIPCRCTVQSDIPNPDTAPTLPVSSAPGTAPEPPLHPGPVVHPGPKNNVDVPGTRIAIPKLYLYAGGLVIALAVCWCCWRKHKRRKESRRRNRKRRRSKYAPRETESDDDSRSERSESSASSRSRSSSVDSEESGRPVRKRQKSRKRSPSGLKSRLLGAATLAARAATSARGERSAGSRRQGRAATQQRQGRADGGRPGRSRREHSSNGSEKSAENVEK
jgi:hypothetical protein